MIKGTVKFFNGTKGFGFITPDDGGKEVFVPSATVTQSGAGSLKAGQRVSFETETESRGPKAVKLTLLDEPAREIPREIPREVPREPREAPRPAIIVYHESEDEDAADVIAALADAGITARAVDYIVAPPPREELKRLSLLLRDASQSLARRYEPLFMELQLDDRFISESEFLTAIFEHPSLINGPIVVSGTKARVCRTAEDVQAFLGNGVVDEKRPKGISARMAAMMLGHAVPSAPEREADDEDEDEDEDEIEEAAELAVREEAQAPVSTKIRLAPRTRKVEAVAPAPEPEPEKKPAAKAPAKLMKAKAPAKPVKKTKK
jgi:CspA family cold shock protein